jgi:hypothetical protein
LVQRRRHCERSNPDLIDEIGIASLAMTTPLDQPEIITL